MESMICEEYLKPNKSKTYLLPLFAKELQLKYLDNLVNSFLFVEGIDEEPIIGVLYQYSDKIKPNLEGDESFIYYIEELQKNELFIKDFELGDYSLFVFKIPEKLNYAYACLIEGKYSWLSPEDKQTIINFLQKYYPKAQAVITRIIGILNRSSIIRKKYEQDLGIKIPKDLELSSKISLELETFDINKILIHNQNA